MSVNLIFKYYVIVPQGIVCGCCYSTLILLFINSFIFIFTPEVSASSWWCKWRRQWWWGGRGRWRGSWWCWCWCCGADELQDWFFSPDLTLHSLQHTLESHDDVVDESEVCEDSSPGEWTSGRCRTEDPPPQPSEPSTTCRRCPCRCRSCAPPASPWPSSLWWLHPATRIVGVKTESIVTVWMLEVNKN